ncbi:hypothetical protein FB45DRAFT_878733 [Roridomyces roridus]|uniref:Uncharacterized protein n=1 Tax=Roridomyces roridus TaxID=1738132 RepID=A0AAD7B0Z7_9AGAR|nr:hypothetical protein FB45DRAFT_878733 [Roridomyces roridus]
MYHIKGVTAGVIVSCAVLAIWLHSPDVHLQERGDTTRINYRKRHSEYLEFLVDGLREGAVWAEELLRYWNDKFFPDGTDGDEDDLDGDRDAENEDLEEARAIFQNAQRRSPSPTSRQPTQGPSNAQRRSPPPGRGRHHIRADPCLLIAVDPLLPHVVNPLLFCHRGSLCEQRRAPLAVGVERGVEYAMFSPLQWIANVLWVTRL